MYITDNGWKIIYIYIYIYVFPLPLSWEGGPPSQRHPPPPLKLKFILFYFLYSARSQQKSFKVTFPIEQVYTLFFY